MVEDAALAVVLIAVVVDVDVVEAGDGVASKRTHAECYEMCTRATGCCFGRFLETSYVTNRPRSKMSGYTPINIVSSLLSCCYHPTSISSSRTFFLSSCFLYMVRTWDATVFSTVSC